MKIEYTHTIPIIVYSTNAVTFMKERKRLTEGKEMVNESSYVIPQFIPAYKVRPQSTSTGIAVMNLNEPAEIYIPQEMAQFYTYYGEYRCTEREYLAWEEKNQLKK